MIPNMDQDHHVYTDASDIRFAGYFEGQWFAVPYDENICNDRSINWREMQAVVTAAATWGSAWSGKRIILHCDNECIVHVVNNGICRSPEIMDLVRELFLISASHQFTVHCVYINTHENKVADALSHMEFARFWQEAPKALVQSVTRVVNGF